MSNILHTKNKWTAAACFILGLMLVLMLSTAVFFTVTLGLLDLRGPEWKWVRIYGAMVWLYFWVRIYGAMVWLYFWQYMTYRWMKRHTTWWGELTEEKKQETK